MLLKLINPWATIRLILFLSIALSLLSGCASLTRTYPQGKIEEDAHHPDHNDLAGLGAFPTSVYQARIKGPSTYLSLMVYQPTQYPLDAPGVVLLPGVMASVDQYESYARALASRGFIVALREWYSYAHEDEELAHDALFIKEWLKNEKKIDPKRIALLGHSMGAKDAMLAGLMDPSFAAIVSIDPDNQGELSVASSDLVKLIPPLFLIGSEVSWQGPEMCAPKDANYEIFYRYAPQGTLELTLKEADHVQMLDDPDRFGYNFCRVGSADSDATRILARSAVVAFLTERLQAQPKRLDHLAPKGTLRKKEKSLKD